MSQDPPNPPEPQDPDTQESPKVPEVTAVTPEPVLDVTSVSSEQELGPSVVGLVRSQLKARTIQVLQTTIQFLEGVVTKLEAEPASGRQEELPAGNVVPALIAEVTGKLTTAIAPLWEKLPRDRIQIIRQQVSAWWNPILERIRGYLPDAVNQQLSDRALTGVLSGLLVIVLWTTSGLLLSPPKPTAIATAPSVQPGLPPAAGLDGQQAPVSEDSAPTPSAPIGQTAPEITLPPVPTPAPPVLKLSPEQKLIAAIQDQVAEVSNQYVSGLIKSVQANFRSSRLTVKVGEGWYELTRSQQDKLANEVLRRAQELDFSKLELTDSAGALLARSPVVGSEMVILKRTDEAMQTG